MKPIKGKFPNARELAAFERSIADLNLPKGLTQALKANGESRALVTGISENKNPIKRQRKYGISQVSSKSARR